jgi:DNA-binding MarR family transcriptional regulator
VPSSSAELPTGVAFLLAQVGQHASDRFAERVAALGLNPQQTGILRVIAVEPGRSQQALSDQLGLLPSRVVAFVDDLERRGYLERRRNEADRRLHALHLTTAGRALMQEIRQIARQHEKELVAPLQREQRAVLAELLTRIADEQGLVHGVHPGYRKIGRPAQAPTG